MSENNFNNPIESINLSEENTEHTQGPAYKTIVLGESSFPNKFSNNPKKEYTDDDEVMECQICFKVIKLTSMKKHLYTHTGLKKFGCELCDKRFARKQDLQRHVKLIHIKKRKNLKCKCGKSFLNSDEYLVHLKSHKKSFINCNTCGKKFFREDYYVKHMKHAHEIVSSYMNSDLMTGNSAENIMVVHIDTDNSNPCFKKKHDNCDSNSDIDDNTEKEDAESLTKIDQKPFSNYVSSAIKQAVDQSTKVLNQLKELDHPSSSSMFNHSSSTLHVIEVKTLLNGKPHCVNIKLPPYLDIDISTPNGMKFVTNVVSSHCNQLGTIDGNINVTVKKSL